MMASPQPARFPHRPHHLTDLCQMLVPVSTVPCPLCFRAQTLPATSAARCVCQQLSPAPSTCRVRSPCIAAAPCAALRAPSAPSPQTPGGNPQIPRTLGGTPTAPPPVDQGQRWRHVDCSPMQASQGDPCISPGDPDMPRAPQGDCGAGLRSWEASPSSSLSPQPGPQHQGTKRTR